MRWEMETKKGIVTFLNEFRLTKNEKLALVCWLAFLLITVIGQIAYLFGFNVPMPYLIYNIESGYTGGLFFMAMILWPIFVVYKLARFEEKMIRQRKQAMKNRKTNFKA